MADQKVTELVEELSPATSDLLYLVDDPGGAPVSKKATVVNVVSAGVGIVQEVLYDTTLVATATAFTLTGIGTYDWIDVVLLARTDRAAITDTVRCYYNNDTTANNYLYSLIQGNAAAVTHSNGSDAWWMGCAGANAPAAVLGFSTGRIMHPSNTSWWTTANSESGVYSQLNTNGVKQQWTMTWESTAAVTRIDIVPVNGPNFVAGSRCIMIGCTVN